MTPNKHSEVSRHAAAKNSTTTPRLETETGAQKEHPLKTTRVSPVANTPDFELANHGSLYLLCPLNAAAKVWMGEHPRMDSPETQFWGDAIVIEPRYVGPIIDGILADRLALR
jgi:hypothetical protein